MGRGFNLVNEVAQSVWLGKRVSFELDGEVFYGKVNLFTKDGVEIKWEGPCPSDGKLGGIAVYANVGVTLSQLTILEG
ncbi:hypothetical protein IBT50_25355 [Bacillus sp. S70]|uniref:hypothetical protein n=1 Tax=unclassified Bacillus (in: firmicutes) TaxID=185979 RepID=UPI00190CA89C|nr:MULTISPECIES: hypothetical protein [unclassified Bacillus (in: firmicutes)]MBJ9983564.1 hypothetical protein [Bacillus sp. S29]MBK0104690.1 hypothetical protein [Bacillus sp. S70]MBK0110036.1 hypothetical protein [Bacillus sp. S73]MBK0138817.1 hypothetical protein [Bacillus sp. S72]MBK0148007.1 hypothetical protein [Bacillus sp. S74]